jgi:hypothetical protein
MAIKNKTKNYSIKNLTDPSTTHKLQKKSLFRQIL